MKAFRDGSPVRAWSVATAVGCACFEALNPTIWFSSDVLGLARVVAALGDAAGGLIVGGIAGALSGLVAAMFGAGRLPAEPKRARAAGRRFCARLVAGGILVGLAAGGFDLAITPERASFVACTTIQSDYDAALAGLRRHALGTTIAAANRALGLLKGCDGSAGSGLMAGALYTLRGAAYFQTDVLPTRANRDFDRAAKLIARCAVQFPPGSGARAQMCREYQLSVERYRSQHFCDDALALANDADNEVFHDAAAAERYAERGAVAAGKCRNLLSYAYRGIALAERAQAQILLGEPAAATLRESRPLLARCLASVSGGLASECRNAQRIVAAARSSRALGH